MMSVQTNVNALSAQRGLGVASTRLQDSMAKLSSGYRINKAADDAAGLAISEKMKAQIAGLNQAMRNSMDAVSLVQTADGALGEITSMVQRMRVLAVQSATDVNTAEDRNAIQTEVTALQSEITRLANATAFNGINLLDGTFQNKTFQVGAFEAQTIDVSVADARSTALGSFEHRASGADLGGQTASATTTASGVDGDTFTITGKNGSALITIGANNTAEDMASAVNAQFASTGVKATAVNYVKMSAVSATGSVTFDLASSTGTATTIAAVIASVSDLRGVRDAINAVASGTGVSAEIGASNAEIILTQGEGADITILNWDSTAAGSTVLTQGLESDKSTSLEAAVTLTDAAADSSRYTGSLDFASTSNYSITGAAVGEVMAAASTTVTTLGNGALSAQSVATQGGAAGAIGIIDSALEKLNDMRAQLGAAQNRFESTAAALESSSENLSAANSRIRDTDIAAESAELARSQVLTQAGVSVLAQANQLPQMALKLLG